MTSEFTAKTRFFNSIKKSPVEGHLIKSSTDIKKIKAEYDYYYALPDDVKPFFVSPYNYKEQGNVAHYCMAEFSGKNVAEQIVDQSLGAFEFELMFSKLRQYRDALPIEENSSAVDQNSYELVLSKTKERVLDLNKTPWAASSISSELRDAGIVPDKLYEKLKNLYFIHYSGRPTKRFGLSHGDLTFSNVLWDKKLRELKLVDPRGIDSMYLDEYYDLAKLSQSIFGRYDDIIYGAYTLDINNLKIQYHTEASSYIENVFIEYLDELSVNMNLLRLYEASLFLSMTPLHVEDHMRVAAFLVDCSQILDSVESAT